MDHSDFTPLMIFREGRPLTSSARQIEALAGASIPRLPVTWHLFFSLFTYRQMLDIVGPWTFDWQVVCGAPCFHIHTDDLAVFSFQLCGSEENLHRQQEKTKPPSCPDRSHQLNSPEAEKPPESVGIAHCKWIGGRRCCHSAASGPFGRAKPISQWPVEEEDECLCSSPSLHHHPSPGFHMSAAVGQASSHTSRQQRRRRIPACLSCLEGGMSSDEKLWSSCLFTSLSRRLDSSQAPQTGTDGFWGEKR